MVKRLMLFMHLGHGILLAQTQHDKAGRLTPWSLNQRVGEMKKKCGFTLIELMVTVAIIGILAAIAYPSYQEHIRKSRRAEAQSVLMNIAGRQQQFLLDTRAYATTLADLGVTVPTSVTSFYTVTLDDVINSRTAPAAFTATATPLGDQATDKCGSPGSALTVNQSGAKTPDTCW